MDIKGSLVKGGVSIIHEIHEGKHQYEVENIIKFKKANGGKPFARKGDKLMQINGFDLQDVIPEQLAEMLAKGNPMLVVHQASKVKEHHIDQTCTGEDALHPVSKETTLLHFSLEMKKEEELEDDERKQEEEGGEGEDREDEVCHTGEMGEKGDLLIVALKNTSITVVKGRACSNGSSCKGCSGKGCTFNEVVVVAESSMVTLVPRGSSCSSFKQEKTIANISLEHFVSHKYLRSFCTQNRPYMSPNPEKITIYHYRSDCTETLSRGVAVALNFTDSNCFLKCCKEGERVFLKVEACEKKTLKKISKTDENALSFVFYMKSMKTKQRRFESALCHGWFIQIIDSDTPEMKMMGGVEDPSFFFVIQK